MKYLKSIDEFINESVNTKPGIFKAFFDAGIPVGNTPSTSKGVMTYFKRGDMLFYDYDQKWVEGLKFLKPNPEESQSSIYTFDIIDAKTLKKEGTKDIQRGNLKYLRTVTGSKEWLEKIAKKNK